LANLQSLYENIKSNVLFGGVSPLWLAPFSVKKQQLKTAPVKFSGAVLLQL